MVMDPHRWQNIQTLFEQALERHPRERDAFLQRACAGDAELMQEVASLLAADSDAHSLLAGNALDAVPFPEESAEVGRRVGSYRIVSKLGTGGMGSVFLAARVEGEFEQKVALKLIKSGMDSDVILKRFRSERQILARLEHPNIARLLDGGMTDARLPYFAMEYVDGVPIDQYCDNLKMTVKQRLGLFQTVCVAVQYAHRNLVVHRDLKPGNILVTADGTVKLLDFGIAKVLADDGDDSPPLVTLTQADARVMTPEYAAPEQVKGQPVTTATDVYALGVILYELLTGQRPYQLLSRSPSEIEKIVSTTEPDKPSTAVKKISTGGTQDSSETTWQLRSTPLEQLQRQLKGDLDNICLLALRKEPERRYGSPEQFLEDIKRFLAGLPVSARKDTAGYRARKFIQRNTGALTATVAAVLLLASLTTFYTIRLSHERDRARVEAKKAEQVSEFLSGLFEISDPGESGGEAITVRELLDRGAQRIELELAEQPEVQATMMGVMGDVYRSLGLYDAAQEQLQRAVRIQERVHGPDGPEVADALFSLAVLHHDRFDQEATRNALTRVLALQRRQFSESSPEITKSLHLLAQIYYLEGKYEAADSLYQNILTENEASSKEKIGILRDYGALQRELGNYAKAEDIYRRTLKASQSAYGELHPEIAIDLHSLGDALRKQGKLDAGESAYRKALQMREKLFGEVHPDVGETLNHLSRLLYGRGDYTAAEPLARRALDVRKQVYGEENVAVVASNGSLAGILKAQGNLDEAERLYRWNVRMTRKLVGDEHPYVAAGLNSVAATLLAKGDLQEAEKVFRQSLTLHRKVLPEGHVNLSHPLSGLGQVLLEEGDVVAAEPLLREALDLRLHALGKTHWRTAEVQATLGQCMLAQQNFSDAEQYFLQSYTTFKEHYPERTASKQRALQGIISLYEKWGRTNEAEKYRKTR